MLQVRFSPHICDFPPLGGYARCGGDVCNFLLRSSANTYTVFSAFDALSLHTFRSQNFSPRNVRVTHHVSRYTSCKCNCYTTRARHFTLRFLELRWHPRVPQDDCSRTPSEARA